MHGSNSKVFQTQFTSETLGEMPAMIGPDSWGRLSSIDLYAANLVPRLTRRFQWV